VVVLDHQDHVETSRGSHLGSHQDRQMKFLDSSSVAETRLQASSMMTTTSLEDPLGCRNKVLRRWAGSASEAACLMMMTSLVAVLEVDSEEAACFNKCKWEAEVVGSNRSHQAPSLEDLDHSQFQPKPILRTEKL